MATCALEDKPGLKNESLIAVVVVVVISSLPNEGIRRIFEVSRIREGESWASGHSGEDDIANVERVEEAEIEEAEDGVVVVVLVLLCDYLAFWMRAEVGSQANKPRQSSATLVLGAETSNDCVCSDVFENG